jgi:hypothetical protein
MLLKIAPWLAELAVDTFVAEVTEARSGANPDRKDCAAPMSAADSACVSERVVAWAATLLSMTWEVESRLAIRKNSESKYLSC